MIEIHDESGNHSNHRNRYGQWRVLYDFPFNHSQFISREIQSTHAHSNRNSGSKTINKLTTLGKTKANVYSTSI